MTRLNKILLKTFAWETATYTTHYVLRVGPQQDRALPFPINFDVNVIAIDDEDEN